MDEFQDKSTLAESPSIPAAVTQASRLPSELLAAIFIHLSGPQDELLVPGIPHNVQDLISATHVCKFWRQAAISAPELWAKIKMTNLEGAKAFLERSGVVPLNVYLHLRPGTRVNYGVLGAVAQHVHRFRQFTIYALEKLDYNPFALLAKAAPLLERLRITYPVDFQHHLLFDDQVPQLRKLVLYARNIWLQNHLGNLTSLHLTLTDIIHSRSQFLPFFDMLRRCPSLEEMFVWWSTWDEVSAGTPIPRTVPLHQLRRLLLRSFRIENIKYLLHTFDLRNDGIAIHLSEVYPYHPDDSPINSVQGVFQNENSSQPSLTSSTKLELVFHSQLRIVVLHALGPGFAIRIDMRHDGPAYDDGVDFTFYDVFPSVTELWVRGSSRWFSKLDGIGRLTALETLVLDGRGSKLAENFREALSLYHPGTPPCPLLSAIDCHGSELEMQDIFLLVRARLNAGSQLDKLRIPSSFIPPPSDISSHVRDVTSLDTSSRESHAYSMELPGFCFAEDHEWWQPWTSV